MTDMMPPSFILYFAIFIVCMVVILWMLYKIFKADKAIDDLFDQAEEQAFPVELGQGHARREENAWRCAQSGCNAPESECMGVCPPCNHKCNQGRSCPAKRRPA